MITKTHTVTLSFSCLSNFLAPKEQLLFFDIETTGLSPSRSTLYLIGTLCFKNNCWQMTQWMIEKPEEEILLLKTFHEFITLFTDLVHFNGTSFDIPYLEKKAHKYQIQNLFENKSSHDLYQTFRSLRNFLQLSHMNQTSLESFLNITREDIYDGKTLIPIFKRYVGSHDEKLARTLLLHNHDDLLGMLQLLTLYSYGAIWNGQYQVELCELDTEEENSFSLIFHLLLTYPLPKPFSRKLNNGYLVGENHRAKLLVYGIKGTLKYFFPNYKDYYYLPLEDTAIHKSIGSYVDRDYRVQAKASTCYLKKNGAFLPYFERHASVFKTNYSDADSFIEFTTEFLHNNSKLHNYTYQFIHGSLE